MFQMYAQVKRRQNAEEILEETTGHDRFYQKERSRYFVFYRLRVITSEIRPLESCPKKFVLKKLCILIFFITIFFKKMCPYIFYLSVALRFHISIFFFVHDNSQKSNVVTLRCQQKWLSRSFGV